MSLSNHNCKIINNGPLLWEDVGETKLHDLNNGEADIFVTKNEFLGW